MSPIVILLLGVLGLCFGWFVYSRYVATHIYRLDPDFVTPAHELEDGVDYVPTNKYVLWGHHFTSVAGAAPIVGPAIAVYWGWVPAILWVIFGTVFFAGVHDMGALWASSRHKGKSIGALSEAVIGTRTPQSLHGSRIPVAADGEHGVRRHYRQCLCRHTKLGISSLVGDCRGPGYWSAFAPQPDAAGYTDCNWCGRALRIDLCR